MPSTPSLSLPLLSSLFSVAHSFTIVGVQPRSDGALRMTSDNDERKIVPFQSDKPPQALIWDIDGTLSDSWKLGFDATQVVLKNNNIDPISPEIYHEGTRYSTPDRLARHAGLIPSDGQKYTETGNRLGAEFDNLYVGLVSKETAGFFEGIDELLNDLLETPVKLGALTNACVGYAHAVLKTNSKEDNILYERFGSICGADNVPAPKPEPDGLYQVCKEIGVDAENCVYIGDSPSDAMAAYNAGMPSIGVMWGSHSEENVRKAPFTQVCKTVEELRIALNVGVYAQQQ